MQMLLSGGSICGRLAPGLPLGCLQGGKNTSVMHEKASGDGTTQKVVKPFPLKMAEAKALTG